MSDKNLKPNLCFTYENGYKLELEDLGSGGVLLRLFHEVEEGASMLLSPDISRDMAEWLLKTLGQSLKARKNRWFYKTK